MLGFCRVSLYVRSLRLAEVQITTQRFIRNTDQEGQHQAGENQYVLDLAHMLGSYTMPVFRPVKSMGQRLRSISAGNLL